MAANRQPPTLDNTPAGISGEEYAQRVYEEVVALWNYVGGALTSVSGTNTITASASPLITLYSAGQQFSFLPANNNSGAVTLNVNGLGAKSVTDALGSALVASDLIANKLVVVEYDGTVFRIISNNTLVSTATGRFILSHELADGQDGGTATSGSEQTYPWEKLCVNTIAGASANLASDTFTLPAGNYEGDFTAWFYNVSQVKARLYNVTDGVYEDTRESVFPTGFAGSQLGSIVAKISLTLTASKTFRIVYRVQSTRSGDGLGIDDAPSGYTGQIEQYGFLSIKSMSSATGTAGTSIRTTNGVPSNGLGANGDLAINYVNGDLYEKVVGVYTLRGNLKGIAGNDGIDGASLLTGSGVPSNLLGANGDSYIDADSLMGDLWFKSGGVWADTGENMKVRGLDGIQSDDVTFLWVGTQVEYDAIPVKSETTLYYISEL